MNKLSGVLIETKDACWRYFRSPVYNYNFNKVNGFFARWGKNVDEDPQFSPVGPEILDIEISTICHQGCSFCYKSNTALGQNMSLETFQKIFHLFPRTLTQIAFGIGSIDANPDLWKILNYTRHNSYNPIVPNITINGYRMTEDYYQRLATICGAVAVSNYGKNVCYSAVEQLHKHSQLPGSTLKQVNIHQLLCEETYDQCMNLMQDKLSCTQLKGLNAIVFLLLKPKGRSLEGKFTQIRDLSKYRQLINFALDRNIPIGFDSCTAPSFLKAMKDHKDYHRFETCCEPCESDCFSAYVNTEGRYFHCSFTEGEDGWQGIDLLRVEDFMEEVWNGPEVKKFRQKLVNLACQHGCRSCPIFNLEMQEP
jgi:hypothetical protein